MSNLIDVAWEACRHWAKADGRRACVHIGPRQIKLMLDWERIAVVAAGDDGLRDVSAPAIVVKDAGGREAALWWVDIACRPPGTEAGAYVSQWLDGEIAKAAP